ncbi:MAG TPA: MMPL family transporter [Solirubrobacteraceae bacterium]|nr:MMPL family transporter [Solirubrobacteraceae bacterium]
MATLLQRLATLAFRRRRAFVATWVLVIVAVLGLHAAFGSTINSDFTIPGSSSQDALDQLHKSLPPAAGTSAQIVFESPAGTKITDAQYRTAVEAALSQAKRAPQVAAIVDPFTSKAISRDGRSALAQIEYTVTRAHLDSGALPGLVTATKPARQAGLLAHVGGSAYGSGSSKPGPATAIGAVIAFVILCITFGSLLAAGLPLLAALGGLAVSVTGVYLVSNIATVSSTAPSLALMIGLAVGIDYSVFILSRYRSELTAGRASCDAIGAALGTAGSAVVFAGVTVFIALAGLAVVGIPFLTVMGLSAAGAVAVAVLGALTLLPAAVGFAGHRLAPKPDSRAARRERPGAAAVTGERWARFVTRHPLRTVAIVVTALLVLTIPALSARLALADNGSAATGTTQRQAYDLVSAEFGPGFNGPLTLLVQAHHATNPNTAASAVAAAVETLPGVLTVTPPRLGNDGTAVVSVVPRSGPHDSATTNLVNTIRAQAPAMEATDRAAVSVTGPTAVGIDVSDRLSSSLLPFAALVVGLALVLLMIKFRSIVVPIKAALGFLLSIGASLGAVVAVFQWGWAHTLVGAASTGPVISFLPIILIAVLFGLAMDYEVFMVSRIREAYLETNDPSLAVVRGGRQATRIVTAAALIMFSVFASFVGTPDATLKTIAFGLGVGVLVDAFVVRMTLVPAVLTLLGHKSWWLPRRLDRALPNLDAERTAQPSPS